uniref:Uncharacterized protein n=1 Tax=Acrobeloides nanus TaxID=290746 RepID=A0A914E0E9_9BILA
MSNVLRRPSNVFTDRFRRLQRSFRDQAHSFRSAIRDEAREGLRRARTVPKWIQFIQKIYHDYGLKHICLILLLVAYQFLGAGIFYYCEVSNDETKEMVWRENIQLNRTKFIHAIIPTMYYIFHG